MSARAKLWLGFGMLTALLALFSITVIIDLRGIQRDLYEQSEIARPRSATARQMEIHLLGYALAVRTYLDLRDARFLEAARGDAAALNERLADYTRLARTPRQQELAARFASTWKSYSELAERIVSRRGADSARDLEQLVAIRQALESALKREIQAEAQRAYEELKNATATRMQALVRLAAFLLFLGVAIGLATALVVSRSVLRNARERDDQRTVTS